jgi:hypothetical protein
MGMTATANVAPTTPAFTVEATYDTVTGAVAQVTVRATVPTFTDAYEIATQFPQLVKLGATTLHTYEKGECEEFGYLYFDAKLKANGINGGVNETGLKRYRSLRKHLARLGYSISYVAPYGNSYADEAAFEAAVK